ncbi:hypothetical protein Hanom_Chr07g00613071 [Helianthus anomalus]
MQKNDSGFMISGEGLDDDNQRISRIKVGSISDDESCCVMKMCCENGEFQMKFCPVDVVSDETMISDRSWMVKRCCLKKNSYYNVSYEDKRKVMRR